MPDTTIEVQGCTFTLTPFPDRPEVRATVDFLIFPVGLRVRGARVVWHDSGRVLLHLPDEAKTMPCPKCRAGVAYYHRFCPACALRVGFREIPADSKGRRFARREVVGFRPHVRRAVEAAVLRAYDHYTNGVRLYVPLTAG